MCSLVKIKSIPDWHLFITQMEMKRTKWYAMTSHVIAYRSLELLFGTHTFHFNCLFEDFNCVFTQIRCLSRVLTSLLKSLGIKNTFLLEHDYGDTVALELFAQVIFITSLLKSLDINDKYLLTHDYGDTVALELLHR